MILELKRSQSIFILTMILLLLSGCKSGEKLKVYSAHRYESEIVRNDGLVWFDLILTVKSSNPKSKNIQIPSNVKLVLTSGNGAWEMKLTGENISVGVGTFFYKLSIENNSLKEGQGYKFEYRVDGKSYSTKEYILKYGP